MLAGLRTSTMNGLPAINTGNTGFMILCAALVMFMTPGLAFFYGGLVGPKNVLGIMIQSFISLAWTTVIWFAFGYSMCFGPTIHGIIGDPTHFAFLHGITLQTLYAGDPQAGIPTLVHVAYQLMFAIITPALITGACAHRVTFKAYMWFLTFWLILVYFPFCHMVWGTGGILADWGVKDFAGGIVVHNTAGLGALASILFVGKRKVVDNVPHSIPFIALGTGMLWFGWFGFNAGSEFKVDAITAAAFLNTHTAASTAGVTWLILEWSNSKKPKFVGFLTGAVAGLATITPASGFVSPGSAFLIGIGAGVVCFYAVVLKNKLGWDDALDVWGVHGVGGFIGVLMLGLFADKAWNNTLTDNGLFMGGGATLFGKQVVAVVVSSVWAFVFTYGMLWAINLITRVRVKEDVEHKGLDEALHGEQAYSLPPAAIS
jgi:Amt family ammonium transporter